MLALYGSSVRSHQWCRRRRSSVGRNGAVSAFLVGLLCAFKGLGGASRSSDSAPMKLETQTRAMKLLNIRSSQPNASFILQQELALLLDGKECTVATISRIQ
ncbi:hypothetical protein N7G274_005355 [Stereocaulon virgatum]|uniref:Uncharacterized protein n=1 Tax=Stereocaulon virgatum TaxID=373712 RepID=A0ABR4ACE7_9LECA